MKKGVLLLNLGGPNDQSSDEIKAFWQEYLMDPMVTDAPFLMRKWKVKRQLTPDFLAKMTAMYATNAKKEASALVWNSTKIQQKLTAQLTVPVALGMRYKRPSIHRALQLLSDEGVKEVLVVPLYPQYTMGTTWSAVEKVKEIQFRSHKKMDLTFLNSFYKHPDFIQTLADHILQSAPETYDRVLLSFPNINKSHDQLVKKRAKTQKDLQLKTYEEQCLETTDLLREKLNLSTPMDYSFLTMGHEKVGLKPDTLDYLRQLPQENAKKVLVICAGAVTDSAATLVKINQQGKALFLENGGEKFTYVKCFNDADAWIEILVKWIQGWTSIKNEL